jgi:hypothetical protein
MVPSIYRSIVHKYNCPDSNQKKQSIADLRQAAGKMRDKTDLDQPWGFKLPELLLILPEILEAFPNARFVNFIRRPVGTVLRRSHMTARLDNHIGRIALKEAYRHFSRSIEDLLSDDSYSRMAITTLHQLALTRDFHASLSLDRWLEIGFEDTISDPEKQLEGFSNFTGLPIQSKNIVSMISSSRARPKLAEFSTEDVKRVEGLISQYAS